MTSACSSARRLRPRASVSIGGRSWAIGDPRAAWSSNWCWEGWGAKSCVAGSGCCARVAASAARRALVPSGASRSSLTYRVRGWEGPGVAFPDSDWEGAGAVREGPAEATTLLTSSVSVPKAHRGRISHVGTRVKDREPIKNYLPVLLGARGSLVCFFAFFFFFDFFLDLALPVREGLPEVVLPSSVPTQRMD